MNCPKCQTPMREREREAGGEIVVMDVCPSCGGIWLDRGELEKLTAAESRAAARADDGGDDDDRRGDGGGHGGGGGKKRERGGFLGNLFDFD